MAAIGALQSRVLQAALGGGDVPRILKLSLRSLCWSPDAELVAELALCWSLLRSVGRKQLRKQESGVCSQ